MEKKDLKGLAKDAGEKVSRVVKETGEKASQAKEKASCLIWVLS